MSMQPTASGNSRIYWPSVITVISAAILIGAEVFGAAFAGGWALAILVPHLIADIVDAALDGRADARSLDHAVTDRELAALAGELGAQRIEPFTRRA